MASVAHGSEFSESYVQELSYKVSYFSGGRKFNFTDLERAKSFIENIETVKNENITGVCIERKRIESVVKIGFKRKFNAQELLKLLNFPKETTDEDWYKHVNAFQIEPRRCKCVIQ